MSILDRLNNSDPIRPVAGTENGSKAAPASSFVESVKQRTAQAINDLEKLASVKPAGTTTDRSARRDFLLKVLDVHRALINESGIDINKFNISTKDPEEFKQIKGTIEKGSFGGAWFTDTPENVAKLIASEGDQLFVKTPIRLERLK